MTTFAILNVETCDFYSESPTLKNEAKRTGRRWDNTSELPTFARRYACFKDAARRSQQLFNKTGCVREVVVVNDLPR